MTLFIEPPKIVAADYLPADVAVKLAGTRLMSPPAGWSDEVVQTLGREYPFIPLDRVLLSFRNKDDSRGYAIGHLAITGAPRIRIPVIIKDWELAPLDIMVIKTSTDQDLEQGAGDMDDDQVVPLTEDAFNQALDAGSPGELVQGNLIRGSAWTEDGSSLRLPYRGRVVVASAMGATQAQRDALAAGLKANKQAGAGFILNNTTDVLQSWLDAGEPKRTVQTKLASAMVKRGHAERLLMVPEEKAAGDIAAARVFVEGDLVKTAVCFEGVDLANPAVMNRWLVFEDGACVRAPEKLAVVAGDESSVSDFANRVLTKIATAQLLRGSEVVLRVDDMMTSPLKVASVAVSQSQGTMTVEFESTMGQRVPVVFQPGVKTSAFAGEAGWVLPVDTNVLLVKTGEMNRPEPIEPSKLAGRILHVFPDEMRCSNGVFTLAVDGQPTDIIQQDEKTAAAKLNLYVDNADEVIAWAKEAAKADGFGAGLIRFDAEIRQTKKAIDEQLGVYEAFPVKARELIADIGMPLDKALKLAAAIGSPDAVDSVLGTGFLTEDNLSEFFGLSGQFEETVEKLARLLYAIRLGFPGDESATSVAMKSLQRVTDRLRSVASGM